MTGERALTATESVRQMRQRGKHWHRHTHTESGSERTRALFSSVANVCSLSMLCRVDICVFVCWVCDKICCCCFYLPFIAVCCYLRNYRSFSIALSSAIIRCAFFLFLQFPFAFCMCVCVRLSEYTFKYIFRQFRLSHSQQRVVCYSFSLYILCVCCFWNDILPKWF